MFLLDTNVAINAMTKRSQLVLARIKYESRRSSRIMLSTIALHELRFGADKSDSPERNHARINDFLASITNLVPFDADDAAEAGVIRAGLARSGRPIGSYDLLMAAQARRRNLVLVTNNRREFDRVPGLVVDDWTAG